MSIIYLFLSCFPFLLRVSLHLLSPSLRPPTSSPRFCPFLSLLFPPPLERFLHVAQCLVVFLFSLALSFMLPAPSATANAVVPTFPLSLHVSAVLPSRAHTPFPLALAYLKPSLHQFIIIQIVSIRV